MHELIALWDADESLAVAAELEKLYALQDRRLTKEIKSTILTELEKAALPVKAILAGLRKLMVEDLKSVKYITIVEAAREFVDVESTEERTPCGECSDGIVIATDEERRDFAFGCSCPMGNLRITELARWPGGELTVIKGRTLRKK
jgi:hypothetical protein